MITIRMRYKYAFLVKKKKRNTHIPSDETNGYAIDKRDVAGVVREAGRGGTGRGATAQAFNSRGKLILITEPCTNDTAALCNR